MNKYQLFVVGGGPAGYVAAIRGAQLGMKVAIAERSKLGGTCLNRGCIPTKSLLHSANVYAECSKFEEMGIFAENISYDMEKIHERKAKVVETLRVGVAQLLDANGVDVIEGNAIITGENVVTVEEQHTQPIRFLLQQDQLLLDTNSGIEPGRSCNKR